MRVPTVNETTGSWDVITFFVSSVQKQLVLVTVVHERLKGRSMRIFMSTLIFLV